MTSVDADLAQTFSADVMPRYGRHFVELLLKSIDIPSQPAQVLDFACGTGFTIPSLLRRFPSGTRVVALSEDRFALKVLHANLPASLRTVVFPHKENLHHLPFAAATFDFAYACAPTMQLQADRHLIRSVLRVLRPGGTFALCVPLENSFIGLTTAVSQALADGNTNPPLEQLLAQRTPLLDLAGWQTLLRRCGVADLHVETIGLQLPLELPLATDRLLTVHLPQLWLGHDPHAPGDLNRLLAGVPVPTTVTVQIACLRATPGPAAVATDG